MRKITSLLLAFIISFLVGCEDESELNISSKDLVQTTWTGVESVYSNEDVIGNTNFILQFLTQSEGTYIFVDDSGEPYGNGKFWYKIDRQIMTFEGAIVGNWTIMENSKDQIVLQEYRPQKSILVLKRKY